MSSALGPAEVAPEPQPRPDPPDLESIPGAGPAPGAGRTPAPELEPAPGPTVDPGTAGPASGPTPASGPDAAAAPEPTRPEPAGKPSAAPPPAEPSPAASGRDRGTFASLRIRNYRLFAAGQVVSNSGTWMQRIAQDWLVLTLTGSSAAIGITMALQFLPVLLFGLYGGVLADRYPKRRLLVLTQSAMGLFSLVLAVLTLTGSVRVGHVYLLAFLLGLATAVENPARQAFVMEMVGPRDIRNAVSLNSANFQIARIAGPALAGVMIAAVGSGWAFLFNGLSFVAPLTALLLMRTSELHPVDPVPREKGQLRAGLGYVAGRPELLWPIVLVGFIGTFGYNFAIWLTAFVDDVFHADAGTYGLLNTLMAAGALAGALLAARWGVSRMRMLVGFAVLFGVLEIAASLSPSFWLFAVLLVPLGTAGLVLNTTANASVQLATDPEMRGRVMSLYFMVFVGGTPIGAPLVGWATDTFGARVGFFTGGLVSVLAALVVGLVLARIGNLRLRVDLHGGKRHRHPRIAFVPRENRPEEVTAAA